MINALYKAIRENRAPHALLITGMDGSDTSGVALSAAALITTGEADPARLTNCPDCTVLGPGKIGVNDVRELLQSLALRRHGTNRAAVLLDAHTTTPAAQNALLKTLEEPPENTTLLLSGREEELLPTIRSRCSALRLGAEPLEAIATRLQNKGVSSQLARHCAALSCGAPLLAELLASEERLAFRQAALSVFAEALTAPVPPFSKARGLLTTPCAPFDEVSRTPNDQKCFAMRTLLFDWRSVLRDALRQTAGLPTELSHDSQFVTCAARFTSAQIQGMIDLISSAETGVFVMSPEPALDDLIASLFELRQNAAKRKG